MPIRGMPGICPAGGAAAGGATGGGGARFEGKDIILVYSLGPCGGAAGGETGARRDDRGRAEQRVAVAPDSKERTSSWCTRWDRAVGRRAGTRESRGTPG